MMRWVEDGASDFKVQLRANIESRIGGSDRLWRVRYLREHPLPRGRDGSNLRPLTGPIGACSRDVRDRAMSRRQT